ncbi:MAG: GIY-YIG nuclease family protein [Candidatus Omnitrophica bacterium]|nr:GIY-YIG nuclease family protein [Candidatus Omnitrophota bacterium]
MPVAPLSFIKRFDEFRPKDDRKHIPKNTRGIYVLLNQEGNAFNVVYVGMAGGDKAGIHGRLNSHARSERKKEKWSHFSIFEMHDNITRETIQELEGLFRHIYRKDSQSLKLGIHKKFKGFRQIHKDLSNWKR